MPFILIFLLTTSPAFGSVTLKLVDQQGKPVANAVISAIGLQKKSTVAANPIMDQRQRQFVPHVLLIEQGQSVQFPNSDNIRHHIYSFSAPKPFEIRLYKGTGAKPIAFDKPGIVALGCNIHDQMVGYIYVADDDYTAITGPDGSLTLDLDQENSRIKVWHPALSRSHNKRLSFELQPGNQTIVLELLQTNKEASKKRKFKSRSFKPGKK